MSLKVTLVAYKNAGYQLLGLALVGLGIIGIVLPVMPTTIFFILALACFTRSSPKLTAWLLNHPRYGATLRHWQEHKVVPIKAKWFAGIGMLCGFVLLAMSSPSGWVLYMVAVIESSVMIYLLSRPSRPSQPKEKQISQQQVKILAASIAMLIHAVVLTVFIHQATLV